MNILSGDINLFRKTPLGFLIVALSGEKNKEIGQKVLLERKGL